MKGRSENGYRRKAFNTSSRIIHGGTVERFDFGAGERAQAERKEMEPAAGVGSRGRTSKLTRPRGILAPASIELFHRFPIFRS